MLLILSLLCTIIEGARVSTAKVLAERALSTGMDSVFGGYYGPLWDEYHIFGYHAKADNDVDRGKAIAEELKSYMSYSLYPNQDLKEADGEEGIELYNISVDSLSVSNMTRLMDYEGELLIHEAVEYMKYREIGNGLEHLLNKMSLLKTPEKVSYIYEEKQEVEEKLVEIDKGILELMELLDGLNTGKKGIELSKNGELTTKSNFVKKICHEELTMENVGINNSIIFNAIKESYFNPAQEFKLIYDGFVSLETSLEEINRLQAAKAELTLSITEYQEELIGLQAIDKKSKEIKTRIKEIKKSIGDLESKIDELEEKITEQETLIISIKTTVNNSNTKLSKLISDTIPLLSSSMTTIDKIIGKIDQANPLISEYEDLLYSEREKLPGEVFSGLEESLTELKRYTAKNQNGYDFTGMKEILEKDLLILNNVNTSLEKAVGELEQGLYQSSKASFLSAQENLKNYVIKDLRIDYSTLTFDKSKQKSPINGASSLLQSGIMNLIMDPAKLSDKTLSLDMLPSEIAAMSDTNTDFLSQLSSFFENTVLGGSSSGMGGLFQSFGTEADFSSMAYDGINRVAEHFLYQEYIKDHYEMYEAEFDQVSGKPSVLDYEQEYLLVGKMSDQENLSSVISRILFLRMIMDFVSIIGDRTIRDEAKLIASALVGFTGLPILVSITQVLILLFWSFAEALLDVCALMMGKEVPVLKKDVILEFPELFLINRSYLQTKASSMKESKELSLSYQDYLRMFLLLKGKKNLAYRSLDLMQENIKIRYDDSSFRIQNCLFGYEVEADFLIVPKFTTFSFMQKYISREKTPYHFRAKGAYCY